MPNPEIVALRAEIKKLRDDVAELRQCSFQHFEMFITHLVEQDREIADLFSYLMPTLRKVYPGFTASKKQFDAVLNRRRPGKPGGLRDSKKS